jgi:hypothetical protein
MAGECDLSEIANFVGKGYWFEPNIKGYSKDLLHEMLESVSFDYVYRYLSIV